jgi:hypothetical protein
VGLTNEGRDLGFGPWKDTFLVFRVQHACLEYDLNIYLDELDILKETERPNTIDLQSSSDDIYEFSAERSSTGGSIDALNFVSDNHPLLPPPQARSANSLTTIRHSGGMCSWLCKKIRTPITIGQLCCMSLSTAASNLLSRACPALFSF